MHKKHHWNKEKVLIESIKYKHRVDFLRGSSKAYRAAQNLNILQEVCSHMEYKKPGKTYWNEERIKLEALKYNKKLDFQIKSNGAYAAARKLGIIVSVCSHMKHKNHNIKESIYGRLCNKCGIFKEKILMCFSSKAKTGMDSICRSCKSIYSKNRLKSNPEKYNYHTANRRAMHSMSTPKWLNKEQHHAMLKMYKDSKIISKKLNIIHEVDHIIPIRSGKVCGLHVPWNLQIITRTENRSKSNKV